MFRDKKLKIETCYLIWIIFFYITTTLFIYVRDLNINKKSIIELIAILFFNIFIIGIIFLVKGDSSKGKSRVDKSIVYINSNKKQICIFLMIFVSLSVFVFKINFSSINSYNIFIGNNIKQVNSFMLGSERGIRSDEWGVTTPIQLGQVNKDVKFSQENQLLGGMDKIQCIGIPIPTKDISMIGKPFTWGFMLFNAEIGFSWYYVMRLSALLIGTYLLSYLLVKNQKIAILGSFIIGFSPGIQWWLTTASGLMETIIYFEFIVITFFNIFKVNQSNQFKLINAIVLLISMIGFTMVLYPAGQIPFAYLGLIILVGLYFDRKNEYKINKKNITICLILVILYVIIMVITIYQMFPSIIKILNTVYPGERYIEGGNLPMASLYQELVSIFLPFREPKYSNKSELSSFITFSPVIITLCFFNIKNLKKHKILNFLMLFIILGFIFMLIGFPNIILKSTLLYMVPEKRFYIAIGFAITLVILIILGSDVDTRNSLWGQYVIYLIFMIACVKNTPEVVDYIGKYEFVFLIFITSVAIYGLNFNKKIFIEILLILTIISGLTINPINFGIRAMEETDISKSIRMINQNDSGNWMTVEDLWIAKYITAQGVVCLNSLNFPPNIELWEKIDKDKEYGDVYNRYAHIMVELSEEKNKEKFELIQPDVFKVKVSMEDLKNLNVSYLVSKTKLDIGKIESYDKNDNIYIYKLS